MNVLVTDYAWPNLAIERAVLKPLGVELVVADSGDEDELLRLAPQSDAILTCWKSVSAAVLESAPKVQVVSRYGIGVDNIDVEAATRLGIVVTNVPDFCLDEVSDHVLALLLAWARRIVAFDHSTSRSVWDLSTGRGVQRLRGQTLGLVGFGNTARAVARKATALGLTVLAHTPRFNSSTSLADAEPVAALDELLSRSDFVSLHAPLNDSTRYLIDAAAFRRMKPSALLINTSRGALVDEDALLHALQSGEIAGAALDVLTTEPPPADHPLLTHPRVIATPHAAFYSEQAISDLAQRAAEHVSQVLRKERPRHVVNPGVLTSAVCRAQWDPS